MNIDHAPENICPTAVQTTIDEAAESCASKPTTIDCRCGWRASELQLRCSCEKCSSTARDGLKASGQIFTHATQRTLVSESYLILRQSCAELEQPVLAPGLTSTQLDFVRGRHGL